MSNVAFDLGVFRKVLKMNRRNPQLVRVYPSECWFLTNVLKDLGLVGPDLSQVYVTDPTEPHYDQFYLTDLVTQHMTDFSGEWVCLFREAARTNPEYVFCLTSYIEDHTGHLSRIMFCSNKMFVWGPDQDPEEWAPDPDSLYFAPVWS